MDAAPATRQVPDFIFQARCVRMMLVSCRMWACNSDILHSVYTHNIDQKLLA